MMILNPYRYAVSGVTPLTDLIVACGCECGITGIHWTTAAGLTFDTALKRTGTTSMNVSRAGSTMSYTALHTPAGNVSHYSFYLYFTSLPTADSYIFRGGTTTAAIGLSFKQSTSKLHCAGGGTAGVVGATGVTITTGQWYRIDLKIDQTPSAKTADGFVDGSPMSQGTNSSASAGTAPQFSSNSVAITANFNIDDYIGCDGSTNYPVGAHTVEAFVPTADGTHAISLANEFERTATGTDITNGSTDAYQLVDELPIGGTADYINMNTTAPSTDYVEIIFGPAPGVSSPLVAPSGMEVIATWSGAAATNSNRKLTLVDNATLDDVVNVTSAQGTTAINTRKVYMAPPSGGSWVLSGGNGNFNNLRMRFSSTSPVVRQRWQATLIEAIFR